MTPPADVLGRLAEVASDAYMAMRLQRPGHADDDYTAAGAAARDAMLRELAGMVDRDVLEAAYHAHWDAYMATDAGELDRRRAGLRAAAPLLIAPSVAEIGRLRERLDLVASNSTGDSDGPGRSARDDRSGDATDRIRPLGTARYTDTGPGCPAGNAGCQTDAPTPRPDQQLAGLRQRAEAAEAKVSTLRQENGRWQDQVTEAERRAEAAERAARYESDLAAQALEEMRQMRVTLEAAERERDALRQQVFWIHDQLDRAGVKRFRSEDGSLVEPHIRVMWLGAVTRPASGGGETSVKSKRCHAGKDGECTWPECPQERDGRANWQPICPLAHEDDDDV